MASTRTLSVVIAGDAKGAQAAFKDVDTAASGLEGKLAKLSTGLKDWGDKTAQLGKKLTMNMTLPIAAVGALSIKAASDLSESQNKVEVVFGKSAESIKDWAADSARAFGLSKAAAFEAVGTFGNLFKAMDVATPAAAKMSKKLVELSADLASFNNANPEDVLLALRSGLVGEAEPLRKFGVSLSAARIEAEALKMGLGDVHGELTAGEKAQAAYSIIMQDTKLAQGDFANTADGLANRMRIAKGELTNAAAVMGGVLLPAAAGAAGLVAKLAVAFSNIPQPLQKVIIGLGGLLAAAGPVVFIAGKLAQGASYIVTGFKAIVSAAQAMPAVLNAAKTALVAFVTNPYAIAIFATVAAVTVLTRALSNSADVTRRAAEEGRKYGQAMVDTATVAGGGIEQLKNQMQKLRTEMEAAHPTHEVSREDLYKYAAAHDVLKSKIDEIKQTQHEARVAEEARKKALTDIASGTLDVADASEDALKAIQDLQSAVLAASGGEIGYQQSLISREKAQRDLNEAIANYGPDSEEARIASLNLEQANLQVASSAIGLMDTTDKLKKLVKNPEAYEAEIARLQLAQKTYGDASGAIQAQIDKLFWLKVSMDNIPPSKSTTVIANTEDAQTKLNNILNTLNQIMFKSITGVAAPAPFPGSAGAEGAIVSRPTIALIGEAGPEALVPLNSTPGNSPLPSGLGVGGDTTIVVQLDSGVLLRALVPKVNQQAQAGPVFVKAAIAS